MPRWHYVFLYAVIAGGFVALVAGVFAANQIKTTETFIMSSAGSVSGTAVATTFSLYIGDNLSGVATPFKSAYIPVSGVYTGDGNIAVMLENDAATTKSFSLPAVGTTPTPFEILYKDPTSPGKINPTSAGTYTYTLTITPDATMTVYSLAAKAVVTHEYVPGSCADGQPANEKVKTTETFIMSSAGSVSGTAVATTFSLYIGDNLSGVATPFKSAYIPVSGVYTGDGNIAVMLENDAATTKSFSLPAVGTTPTPFEILYKDPTSPGKINPTSAGTYTYTLTITPDATMTVYSLAAKAVVTHRYKPPSCSVGFAASGTVESSTFDTGVASGAAYNWIAWNGPAKPVNTRVKLQLATSNNASEPSWTYRGADCNTGTFYEPLPGVPVEIGCATDAAHKNKRYFRYKVTLCSVDDCTTGLGIATPEINSTQAGTPPGIIVNWSP